MATQSIVINIRTTGAQKATKQVNGLTKAMQGMTIAGAAAGAGLYAVGRAAAGTVGYVAKASNEFVNLSNATSVFAKTSADANFKFEDTIRIAQSLGLEIDAVGTTYQRMSAIQDDVGISSAQTSVIVENLSKAVRISGASSQEAAGALRQFAQGMAANRLSGQELNSILEQTPYVAKLLADSIGEPVARLRELGEAGELTTEVLIKAFGKDIPDIEKRLKGFTLSIEANTVRISQAASLMVGQLAESLNINQMFGDFTDGITSDLDELREAMKLGGKPAVEAIEAVGGALKALAFAVGGLGAVVVGGGLAALTLFVTTVGAIPAAAIAGVAALAGLGTAAYAAAQAEDVLAAATEKANKNVMVRSKTMEELTKEYEANQSAIEALQTAQGGANSELAVSQIQNQINALEGEALAYETALEFMQMHEEKLEDTTSTEAAASALANLTEELSKNINLTDTVATLKQEYADAVNILARAYEAELITLEQLQATQATYTQDMLEGMDAINGTTDSLKAQKLARDELNKANEEAIAIQEQLSANLPNSENVSGSNPFGSGAPGDGGDGDNAWMNEEGNGPGVMDQISGGASEGLQQLTADTADLGSVISGSIAGGFNEASQALTDFAINGEGSIGDLGKAMLDMIAQIIIQMLIMLAIQTALKAMGFSAPVGGGGGGIIATGGTAKGERATGGGVGAGAPYLVGERGPELFVPRNTGKIENTSTTAAMMGGQQQQQNVNIINVDDESKVINSMGSTAGQAQIINTIQSNPDVIRGITGSK